MTVFGYAPVTFQIHTGVFSITEQANLKIPSQTLTLNYTDYCAGQKGEFNIKQCMQE